MSVVPLVLRWLLPIVTAIALVGTTMTSFAAAGVIPNGTCCCPNPATCKCHDHDKEPVPAPLMKRCHDGGGKLVVPSSFIALAAEPVIVTTTTTASIVEHVIVAKPAERFTRPEKPPL